MAMNKTFLAIILISIGTFLVIRAANDSEKQLNKAALSLGCGDQIF